MRNLYFLLSPALLLASCGTVIDYVGNSYPHSDKVDVFVTLSSVKKDHTIIGKGFVRSAPFVRRVGERVQKKAQQVARTKGADAIVIQDYLLMQPVVHIDSASKGLAIGNIAVSQGQSEFVVLFLKYTGKE